MRHLEDIKSAIGKYEKGHTENVSNIEMTKATIDELDLSLKTLKRKIEGNAEHFTGHIYPHATLRMTHSLFYGSQYK